MRISIKPGTSFYSSILTLAFFVGFSWGSLYSNPISPAAIRKEKLSVIGLLRYPGYRSLYDSFAVGVVHHGKLVFEHYENSKPEKQYGLASITKMFTATAIMQLVDRGDISLDDPISDYFDDFTIANESLGSREVLIRDLLSHSAGLPDLRYYRTKGWIHIPGSSFRIPYQIYPTGTHYRYSNHGYLLLGELVRSVTGKKLNFYFRDQIFRPLGMNRTATAYWINGAGGIRTTLPDLSRFAAAYMNALEGREGAIVLNGERIRQMTMRQPFEYHAPAIDYCGLGWRVRASDKRILQIYHIGGANRIAAWIQFFPQQDMAVLYLGDPPEYTDKTMGFLSRLQDRLGNLATALAGETEPIHRFQSTRPDEKKIQETQGIYARRGDRKIIRVFTQEDKLLMQEVGPESDEDPFPIFFENYLSVRGGPGYRRMDFLQWEGGRIVGLGRPDGYYDRVSDETFWPTGSD